MFKPKQIVLSLVTVLNATLKSHHIVSFVFALNVAEITSCAFKHH